MTPSSGGGEEEGTIEEGAELEVTTPILAHWELSILHSYIFDFQCCLVSVESLGQPFVWKTCRGPLAENPSGLGIFSAVVMTLTRPLWVDEKHPNLDLLQLCWWHVSWVIPSKTSRYNLCLSLEGMLLIQAQLIMITAMAQNKNKHSYMWNMKTGKIKNSIKIEGFLHYTQIQY